jgi:hypothetical protein
MYPANANVRCSGWSPQKARTINHFVTEADWKKLKFFHVLDDRWLLSHAGIHPHFVDKQLFQKQSIISSTMEDVLKIMKPETKHARKSLGALGSHWVVRAGISRGGSQPYGGVTWLDYREEFVPILGVNQIVGHTPLRDDLRWVIVKDQYFGQEVVSLEELTNPPLSETHSYNLCLDSYPSLKCYAIYDNGTLIVRKTENIK